VTHVVFALENNNQPIGVATYTVTQELPASVKDELPTVEALLGVVSKLQGEFERFRTERGVDEHCLSPPPKSVDRFRTAWSGLGTHLWIEALQEFSTQALDKPFRLRYSKQVAGETPARQSGRASQTKRCFGMCVVSSPPAADQPKFTRKSCSAATTVNLEWLLAIRDTGRDSGS
jgi:hypothetical protein